MTTMLARDKLLHIAMGVGAVIVTIGVIALSRHSLGAALAVMTTAFGVFYEFQQWWRREGSVEWLDALATAAPGFAAWVVIEVFAQGAR